ncbi:MAG: ATP-binding protein [Geminocystis sp.]|nr:ATP-binding protein [Geminocystis sp.]HIK36455.1 GAF domain-containing protein [Geminocystis sp. M7585_C2015_104]MCS7148993.1 ATP-binding protein [Geminocystis sp.]MCX8077367.1 ATP-binding protein [Geminocystis sp.]MDW8114810.1 ATP-binding protein [Geminocystis sp.]
MFTSNQSLISIVVSQPIFARISQLWRELVKDNSLEGIYLNRETSIRGKEVQNTGAEILGFQLFVSEEIQCFLGVEKRINELYYQITISFEPEEILEFLKTQGLNSETFERINEKISRRKNDGNTKTHFLISLLQILAEPWAQSTEQSLPQTLEVILRNKIAQEKIIRQVTKQIQNNLDTPIVVKMTIEQIQSLLGLDRLLIYQINVPVRDEKGGIRFIDKVTYEAKASETISSVLNFSEETCFRLDTSCYKKYCRGDILAIDDIDNYPLDPCLKNMMESMGVKSKLVVPIIVRNRLWGLLIAHQCFSTRKWRESDIRFLNSIAEYLGISIYQYESYQSLREQKKFLEKQVEKKAKQLQDALVAAQIAHRSKTEFLGSLSHELRTPLTCIIGLSGTLLHWFQKESGGNTLSPEKQIRYLEIIQESGRRLMELINNMLDFADLEAGKSLLCIEEISIESILRNVYNACLEIAKNQGVRLKIECQMEEGKRFYGDEDRLYQILFNLVDNGIKFTPSGGEVTIRAMRGKNEVIFQVEDTGIGIDEKKIPLLFTGFQQLENYRIRSYQGTGLGLALTKHLVELHGGTIEVESVVGKGSTFTVILPDCPPESSIRNRNKSGKPTNNQWQGNRIIAIVCEDEEIGTFLCELLTAAEYQVIWLVDVREAISRLSLLRPRIVIVQQKKEISPTVVREIKSQGGKNLYLMVIREDMTEEEWLEREKQEEKQEKKGENWGVDEYLFLPLLPRVVLRKINSLLNNYCMIEESNW